MKFKKDVDVTGLHAMMAHVWHATLAIQYLLDWEITITSGREGKHSVTSSHYSGCAVDIRTKDKPSDVTLNEVATMYRERLPIGFRVIIEARGGDNEHIHIQYRPIIGEVLPV